MVAKQLSEHCWYVQGVAGVATDNAGFISNAGFVVTNEGVVVIDALGTPSLAVELLKRIQDVTDQPVVKVLVTHYHADHIYGLQVFRDLGAKIVAPYGVNDYLDSDAALERLDERRFSLDPWVNDDTELVAPDEILESSSTFTLGGVRFTLSVVGSAHSDGDMTIFVDDENVLYSGDIIFEGRVPYLGSNNTRHWLDTLTSMETNQLKALVPGHGPAASNPVEALALTRGYLTFIREKMFSAVDELMEFDEAYSAVDWSVFEGLPAFESANRRNALQVFLSLEAEATE